MTDNVLLYPELIDKVNSRKKGSTSLASIKIDMSKAYDRVYWDSLLRVLRTYGFLVSSHWVHQCISTILYRVLINGQTSEQIKPNCGIRQGDPLSPYLFLFCMDILSRMLQLGSDIGQFFGNSSNKGEPVLFTSFLRGCNWKVGNGVKIVVGKDRWVKGDVSEFRSNITLQEARTWRVYHFIHPNGSGWNHERIKACFEFKDAQRCGIGTS